MSILSDILSRVKQQQPKRDVPPGLRSTVSAMRDAESRQRKIFLLGLLIVLFTGLGFATLYLVDIYGPGNVKAPAAYQGRRGPVGPQAAAPVAEPPVLTPKKEAVPVTPIGSSKVRTGKAIKPHQPETVGRITEAAAPAATTEQQAAPQPSETQRPLPVREEPAPGMKEAYIYSAESRENSGELPEAVADYRKVLEIEPNSYRIMNKIASIQIRMRRFDDAERHLKDALRIKPDYLPALINSGIASAGTGKTAEAETFLLKALSIDGTSQAALLNIALLYEREKKYDQARDYFLKLRQLGDKNGELGLQRLEQAR